MRIFIGTLMKTRTNQEALWLHENQKENICQEMKSGDKEYTW